MQSMALSVVVVPGVVALLIFLVFTYLYEPSRQTYFRAWQLGWAAYTLHYALDAWITFRGASPLIAFLGSMLLVIMTLCILISTRVMRKPFRWYWYDFVLIAVGCFLAFLNLRAQYVNGVFSPIVQPSTRPWLEIALAAVLLYCSLHFYSYAHRKNSLAFKLLAIALAFWAVLMWVPQFRNPFQEMFGTAGHLLGPLPQMLLGIAMVMVLFENERNAVQENALAFSTLGVDPMRLLGARELVPSVASILERLVAPLPKRRAILYISQQWRAVLPSVERGFSSELL